MLQVTTRAVDVLREERSHQGIPEHFGVRVHSDRSDSGAVLRLAFAEAPDPGDEVGEADGVRVFVAPDVADALSGRALDTHQAPEGAGFVLREQTDVSE
jgi:Fe-S cluster assembly iron-binding protein IscA